MTALKKFVKSQQTDMNRLTQRQNRAGTADLISSVQMAVSSAKSRDDEIQQAPRKKRRKRKSKMNYESSFFGSDTEGQSKKPSKSRVWPE